MPLPGRLAVPIKRHCLLGPQWKWNAGSSIARNTTRAKRKSYSTTSTTHNGYQFLSSAHYNPIRLSRKVVTFNSPRKHPLHTSTRWGRLVYSSTLLKQRQKCIRDFRTWTGSLQEARQQQAPDAQAYLRSGVIPKTQNLVDVKKVLVIGSGGLAIGQAGEFDYSGE